MNESISKFLKGVEQSSAPMREAIGALKLSPPSLAGYRLHELDYRPPQFASKEEVNDFQSAGVLMKHLADSIRQWRLQLPSDEQPAIVAVLNGGIQIAVERLAQETFHGIDVSGGTISLLPHLLHTCPRVVKRQME